MTVEDSSQAGGALSASPAHLFGLSFGGAGAVSSSTTGSSSGVTSSVSSASSGTSSDTSSLDGVLFRGGRFFVGFLARVFFVGLVDRSRRRLRRRRPRCLRIRQCRHARYRIPQCPKAPRAVSHRFRHRRSQGSATSDHRRVDRQARPQWRTPTGPMPPPSAATDRGVASATSARRRPSRTPSPRPTARASTPMLCVRPRG